MKTLIIVPAYNEENNISRVVSDLRLHCPDCDVLIINDCSTDSTPDFIRALNVQYLNFTVNLGIGGAVQAGYKYARNNSYDAAVQFDGDGQHRAEYISTLLKPLEEETANVVIGSRFLENKGFQSSAARIVVISFLSALIRWLSGVEVKDATSGMRAVDRKLIALYSENYAQDFPEPEAIVQAGMYGARVKEVPVEMRERLSGESSINTLKSVYYMIKVSLALILSRISMEKAK